MLSFNEWQVWTRNNPEAKRDYGLSRRPIAGYAELQQRWTGQDEYAGVFSSEQIEKQEFDTFFFDIDAHSGGDWKVNMKAVLERFELPPSRVYATGRGGHLYLDTEEPIVGIGKYKQAAQALVKKWKLDGLIDPSVVGDVRRVARLPGSKNSKGGICYRFATEQLNLIGGEMVGVPLMVAGGMGDVGHVYVESITDEVPRKVELVLGEAQEAERHFGPSERPEIKKLYSEAQRPPCVRIGLKQLHDTAALDHSQRLHVYSWLVLNDEMDYAFQTLKNWADDFDAGISSYQLKNLENHPRLFKCTNVPRDLCPYSNQRECAFFPSVAIHRRRLLEAGAK